MTELEIIRRYWAAEANVKIGLDLIEMYKSDLSKMLCDKAGVVVGDRYNVPGWNGVYQVDHFSMDDIEDEYILSLLQGKSGIDLLHLFIWVHFVRINKKGGPGKKTARASLYSLIGFTDHWKKIEE